MSVRHGGAAHPVQPEVLSPELVLVDPELAVRARGLLVDREESLAPIERLPRAEPVCASSTTSDTSLDDAAAAAFRRLAAGALLSPVAAEPLAPSPWRPWRLAASTAAFCAALSIAVFVADLYLAGGAPATSNAPVLDERSAFAGAGGREREIGTGFETTQPNETSAATTSRTTSLPTRSGSAATSVARRLAWAPVAGASRYQVELYRGASRVFAAHTTRPVITVPARWTFGGRQYGLEAVEYRWYVWPIVSGRRLPKAVVQARLAVRDR